MKRRQHKHILDTMVADKMKPVIKKILAMDSTDQTPEITDPQILKMAEEMRKARAESPPMTLEEARAQTPGWQQAVLEAAERDKKRRAKNSKLSNS